MTQPIYRILAVDDEPRYLRAITVNLEAKGYEVITAPDGPTALQLAASEKPHLVLLDIRMPGLDGYETCRRIRDFSKVPVIMLTALAETANKVKGLGLGADDYMTKPFSAEELVARVEAVLRRTQFIKPEEPQPLLQVGSIVADLRQQRVFVGENEVVLTATEYRLLCELMRNPNQVLPAETLLAKVWGMGYEGEDRLVWRTIHRLRQKIESDIHNPRYIQTLPGSGYMFVSE